MDEFNGRRRLLLGLGIGGAGVALAGGAWTPHKVLAADDASVAHSAATIIIYQQSGQTFAVGANGAVAVPPNTDAVEVINSAISLVGSQGGGSVYFSAGNYMLSNTIKVVSGVHVLGPAGLGSVDFSSKYGAVLTASPQLGFPAGAPVVNLVDAFAAELDHLLVNGNSVAGTGVVVAGRNCRIHDLVVFAPTKTGIQITNGSQTGRDVYVSVNVVNCIIDMNLLPNTTGLVIDVTNPNAPLPTDHLIAYNRIVHNTNYMIFCDDSGPGAQIVGGGSQFIGNHTTGGAFGWRVGNGAMIVGNYFDSAKSTSLELSGRAVTVTGNYFVLPAPLKDPVIAIHSNTTGRFGLTIEGNVTTGLQTSTTFLSDTTATATRVVLHGNVGTGISTVTDLSETGNYIAGNLFGTEG